MRSAVDLKRTRICCNTIKRNRAEVRKLTHYRAEQSQGCNGNRANVHNWVKRIGPNEFLLVQRIFA